MSLHIYGGIECLRFFPDNKDKKSSYAGIKFSKYNTTEFWELIQTMQYQGMGAFITVNQTDGEGAKTENIKSVRSFYIDIDGLTDKSETLKKLITSKLPPSAIVETRNGLHAYWYAKVKTPVLKSTYERVQIGLIKHFNGDSSAKDLARVLRIPETLHLKGHPFMIKVIHQLPREQTPYYTYEELLQTYPAPQSFVRKQEPITPSNTLWEMFLQDLNAWQPISGERNMIMLLSAGVAIKYGVSMESFINTMYNVIQSWDLQRDGRSELRRVAKWAYDKGTPIPASALRRKGVPIRREL